MPKVAYDIFSLPIVEKLTLFNADLLYDTSVSPIQLKGIFEPNYKLGLKLSLDGQIYLDNGLTLGLFNSAIPPHPTTGAYALLNFTFTKQALIGVWRGKTTSDYDTPVLFAINKQIGALLVYNISSNSVQVKHQTSVYPNYETDGTYSGGVVTLAQGQYALFYGATKPTVNPNAKWGFTDYEPKSSTTQPSTYLLVTDGTNNFYYEQTLAFNTIMHITKGAYLLDAYGAKVSSLAVIEAHMGLRGGYNGDNIMPLYLVLDTSPTQYINLHISSIYDYDPIAGTSWSGGLALDNLSYVRDSSGVAFVARMIKSTVEPYNPRYTLMYAYRYEMQDALTVKVRAAALYKALVDITSYGSPNQVAHPGFHLASYVDSTTFKYFNGSSWVDATPGTGSYNYYNGYGIEASIFNPLNTSEVYKARFVLRKQVRYGSPPIKVGAIRFSTSYVYGLIGVFQDYNGGTIPSGNYTGFVVDGLIRLDNTTPTITTETPVDDTAVWSYLYGYPYDISVSAPSSAQPGQQVTVRVATNAPDGRKVYVVDKDTDTVLGSGTVSGGQATVSFTMPNKNLNIRVYVEGADIALA